jgi:hypothetical protein
MSTQANRIKNGINMVSPAFRAKDWIERLCNLSSVIMFFPIVYRIGRPNQDYGADANRTNLYCGLTISSIVLFPAQNAIKASTVMPTQGLLPKA